MVTAQNQELVTEANCLQDGDKALAWLVSRSDETISGCAKIVEQEVHRLLRESQAAKQ